MSVWNLASILAHHADRFGDRPCLVSGDETITYGELDRRSAATAAGLAKLGVSRGDVVAILLSVCPSALRLLEVSHIRLRARDLRPTLDPRKDDDGQHDERRDERSSHAQIRSRLSLDYSMT